MKPLHSPICISSVLDSIHEGVMLVNPEGIILQVNQAMERITGFSRSRLEGSPCTVLGCDACRILRSESENTWCVLFRKERIKNKRCKFIRKNGTLISARKDARILRDPTGEVIGALEVVRDLTDQENRERVILELKRKLEKADRFCGMIGQSPAMKHVFQLVERAALTDSNILISGDSGTGKELIADALHQLSHRREGAFVKLNCSALTETLMESEMFGHAKGAFTGALQHRRGHFEIASGGDLFLDEIGDLPLSAQAKLLRVVETGEVMRVGGSRPQSVDVRIFSATHRNLAEMVTDGTFREDLYYRLNVFPIRLPPLRERIEDIEPLAVHFLAELSGSREVAAHRIAPEVMDLFTQYPWPGNVRELRSALAYSVTFSAASVLEVRHLPEAYQQFWRNMKKESLPSEPQGTGQKKELLDALLKAGGNQSRAAKFLGVHRMTVFNRMRKYGISSRRYLHADEEN